ncbi:MAG TPA: methyltransferase domain-containing protein [Gammaproteobacteria bacterium]|nr:methyltransferase domain-containing protein [Gammaproteobacteria bacterium]
MSQDYSEAVETARAYYNSEDADTFYFTIWGGEDLHIGMYESADESIYDASVRTVHTMADKVASPITEDTKVCDIGGGYGGTARHLVRRFNCQVDVINLSEVENQRDRQMNQEQGLDHKIDVYDGSFDSTPFEAESYDLVWCQDSILHADDREAVLKEVDRILKPGGEFIFTDPMQTDNCPEGVLDPILARIHLPSLGSPGFYKETAQKLGWEDLGYTDTTPHLPRHYGRVLEELESREEELRGKVSDEYIENMKKGLRHWVEGGNSGYLTWGILHFRKPQK